MRSFTQFMRAKGIRIFNHSAADLEVGDIFTVSRGKYNRYATLDTVFPSLKSNLDISEAVDANILSGTFTINSDENGGIKLPFLNLKANKKINYSVEFEVSGEKITRLRNPTRWQLENFFDDLRNERRDDWRDFKNSIVIMELFYATKFVATFKADGNTGAELGVTVESNNSNANFNDTWLTNEQLEITDNSNVPFGMKGFRIRRFD